jgi:hypothetical protein
MLTRYIPHSYKHLGPVLQVWRLGDLVIQQRAADFQLPNSQITQLREDIVIFVPDVERCLERVDDCSRALITRMIFQDYTWDETAELLRCHRATWRQFP